MEIRPVPSGWAVTTLSAASARSQVPDFGSSAAGAAPTSCGGQRWLAAGAPVARSKIMKSDFQSHDACVIGSVWAKKNSAGVSPQAL